MVGKEWHHDLEELVKLGCHQGGFVHLMPDYKAQHGERRHLTACVSQCFAMYRCKVREHRDRACVACTASGFRADAAGAGQF